MIYNFVIAKNVKKTSLEWDKWILKNWWFFIFVIIDYFSWNINNQTFKYSISDTIWVTLSNETKLTQYKLIYQKLWVTKVTYSKITTLIVLLNLFNMNKHTLNYKYKLFLV